MTEPNEIGPMFVPLKGAATTLKYLPVYENHWFAGSTRSIAIAVELLRRQETIAVPTDTIYGFACLPESIAIENLYNIKKRDKRKPLAICVSGVNCVKEWGVTTDLPHNLLTDLLPGPVTVVLKRTPKLSESLNPGIDNVGIRVPSSKFIRCVARIAGPLALTSANESNKRSNFHPNEFCDLWSELGGIFYAKQDKLKSTENRRIGSTIVDLSQAGYFKILRNGIACNYVINILKIYGLKERRPDTDSS